MKISDAVRVEFGNLLDALLIDKKVDYIAHQCNCFHTFGKGLAKQIKKKIPEVYEADLTLTTKGDRGKLGTYSYANNVFNLYGQYRYGNDGGTYTEFDKLKESLTSVRNSLIFGLGRDEQKGRIVLGLPWLGCGLGGGKREDLLKILDEVFKDYMVDIEVVIYESKRRA